MAADISEITDSNHPVSEPDLPALAEHILCDLHEVLQILTAQGKIQARHDAMLQEFRPLLDQFRTPAASFMAGRRARKAQP
jgi:hypothetical protein